MLNKIILLGQKKQAKKLKISSILTDHFSKKNHRAFNRSVVLGRGAIIMQHYFKRVSFLYPAAGSQPAAGPV